MAQRRIEPPCAVPGLLPEGATLLAGRPKGGKSWLLLQTALAVVGVWRALGRIEVEPGEALYLALEDGPGRLRGRLERMLGSSAADDTPAGLHLATSWPRLKDGCIDALERWLDSHPACRFIAVDTLVRIRGQGSAYDNDYDSLAAFKDLGDRRRLAIGLSHHTRKPKQEEDDPFDSISGTLGLSGAVDAVIVLKKPIGARDGRLHITGRDVEEREINLAWDPDTCIWHMTDDQGAGLPPEQRRVIDILRRANRELKPLEAPPTARQELGGREEAAEADER